MIRRFGDWVRHHAASFAIVLATAGLIAGVFLVARGAASRIQSSGTAAVTAVTGHTAELIAERFAEKIRDIDNLQHLGAILTAAMTVGRDRQVADVMTELRRSTMKPEASILQVWALDPAGDVMWATNPARPITVNLSDRDYFRAIANEGRDSFIGAPRKGAITTHYGIPFSSAARDQNGALRAVIVVALDTRYLEPLAKGLDLTPDDLITLFRDDGLALARSKDIGIGEPVRNPTLLRKLEQYGAVDETGIGPMSGKLSFLSVRRVSGAGLSVLVSRNAQAALGPTALSIAEVRRWAMLISLAISLVGAMTILLFNVTRRHRAVEQRHRDVAASEGLLRQIADGAPVVIGMLDGKRRWIYINGAVQDIFGVSPGLLIGQIIGHSILPEDKPVLNRAFDALDGGSERERLELPGRRGDGTMAWVKILVSSFVISTAGGVDVRRYVTILLDVTSRRLAEDALRQSRAETATLLQNSPGLIYKVRFLKDGTRHTVTAQGTPGSGYDIADLTKPNFSRSILAPEDYAKRVAAFADCLRDGSAVLEFQVYAITGDWIWMRDTMRRGEPEDGDPTVIGFIANISKEYRARQTLAQTERLASLGTVANGIAHEMNQPLAAISMAAENGMALAATSGIDAEPVIRKFSRIIEQVNRISEVITHIRLGGDARAAAAVPFALADAMHGAMLLAEGRVRLAGAEVVCDFDPDLPMILAPRVPVEHVLINLIVNASDAYADRRSAGAVRVIAITARRDGAMVHIRVADAAGGIAPDVLGRVFDPFVSTKPGKGMGLGLSISFATVTEAGGRIGAHNADGGAVFDIHLPVAPAAA